MLIPCFPSEAMDVYPVPALQIFRGIQARRSHLSWKPQFFPLQFLVLLHELDSYGSQFGSALVNITCVVPLTLEPDEGFVM